MYDTGSLPCARMSREGGAAEVMTERRMALVSNGPLAAAAVRCGLHLHLRSGSSSLRLAIDEFAEKYQVRRPSRPWEFWSSHWSSPGLVERTIP